MNARMLAMAVACLAAAPAAADAAEVTIGSDLAAPATAARSAPNDIVWWGTAGVDVPVAGQAIIMRVKGGTRQPRGRSSYPDYDLMHFVVLHAAGDGTWRTTATSVDQRMPVIGSGAGAGTVSTFTSGAAPLCVRRGDRIGLASVGGFDPNLFPHGLPYQVFGEVAGASAQEFRAGGAIAENRTVVRGDRLPGSELLLQLVIGTGPDARPTCGGTAPSGSDPGLEPGPSGPRPPAAGPPGTVRIAKPAREPRMFDGKVRLTLRCAAGADCAGGLALHARGKRIGRRAFRLDGGETDGVSVKLSRRGRRMARRAGRLGVTAKVAIAGGATTTRVVTVRG